MTRVLLNVIESIKHLAKQNMCPVSVGTGYGSHISSLILFIDETNIFIKIGYLLIFLQWSRGCNPIEIIKKGVQECVLVCFSRLDARQKLL